MSTESTESSGQPEGAARVVVQVDAGVIPGQAEPEFSRAWGITSAEWEAMATSDAHGQALAELTGRAAGYATLLTLQPDRLNWVKLEWVWL